ncbi:MAG TPA: hypothetical protein VHL11_09325 [Phototrophicaceae bacterium]|jgi:hypothetical protein|nr:hypothetical protein [Phototrophicaceae bacterium]
MIDLNAQEWVNVTEGAEITGYHPDYVRKLARDNSRLPEEERVIKVRQRSHGYQIWLPDLRNYIESIGNGPLQKRNPHPKD